MLTARLESAPSAPRPPVPDLLSRVIVHQPTTVSSLDNMYGSVNPIALRVILEGRCVIRRCPVDCGSCSVNPIATTDPPKIRLRYDVIRSRPTACPIPVRITLYFKRLYDKYLSIFIYFIPPFRSPPLHHPSIQSPASGGGGGLHWSRLGGG